MDLKEAIVGVLDQAEGGPTDPRGVDQRKDSWLPRRKPPLDLTFFPSGGTIPSNLAHKKRFRFE